MQSVSFVIGICALVSGIINLSVTWGLIRYIEPQPVALKDLLKPGGSGKLTINPADATCGGKLPESICSVTTPITCSMCLDSDPTLRHPLAYLIDDEKDVPVSYWQSGSWLTYPLPFEITITMSFRKDYRLTGDITIAFKNNLPEKMILEKSVNYGGTWEPLEYYSTDCVKDFSLATKRTLQFTSVTEVLCSNPYIDSQHVSGLIRKVRWPLVERLNLLSENGVNTRRLYTELETNPNLRNFLKLTDLRLRLMRPALIAGAIKPADNNRLHYAIYDIDTQLSCECNLHGDYCSVNNGHGGQVVCHCYHGTTGTSCEVCKIGYQLLPWQPASYLPFPDGTAHECTAQPGFSTVAPSKSGTTLDRKSAVPGSNPTPVEGTTQADGNMKTLEAAACQPDPCNSRGMCILMDTALGFRCECDLGYTGFRCERYHDPCNYSPCPPNFRCYSDGGLLHMCFPPNGTLPNEKTTPAPGPTVGPLSLSTIALIVVMSLIIPVFFVLVMVLLWCTTWKHLHPTIKDNTIKYMYDPELNGFQNGGGGGFTNNGYGFEGETVLVPDGVSSMKVRHIRDAWIVQEENLDIGKLLHSGQFSYICEGLLKNNKQEGEQKVVVKLLRDENDEKSVKELKNEFEVMASIGRHPNVLWLMGMCYKTQENDTTQSCLITQYASRGDMLRILRRCRARRRDQEPFSPLPQEELLNFACDIAAGMRHMAALKYVHRNLCAKNVVITFNNKAKIADFGQATDLPKISEAVRFVAPRNKHQVRWMAYEALLEGVYTVESDVWSFGTVLWEIATLGGIPYPNIKTQDLADELRAHYRMDWPKHCTTEFYDIMLRCWHRRPASRPTFDMLAGELKTLKGSRKKQINLKDYTFQTYVPVKLPEDLEEDNMTDSFV